MRFIRYLGPRLFLAAVTLCGVALLVFIALRLIPGGFADIVLGPFGTAESRALLTERFGLDAPGYVQFFKWFWALLGGDFGVSLVTQQSVIAELLRRAPVTGELALLSLCFALAVGLPLGISSAAATARGGGRLGRAVGALGASVPDFVLGSLFIFVFSVWSLGLKAGGYVPFWEDPIENLRGMILPSVTLGVFGMALILRTTRDAVLRVLTEGHITAAVARGERPGDILRHHVLRNASVLILTVSATYFGYLLGGAVIVEVLFSVPGVGFYIYSALLNRDYAVVQGGVLFVAVVFVLLNMLVDLLYVVIDPRIGASRG
ncbi:MAG: ABC transporter permease [Rhodospirillales bacterium]